jgi:hypothetical protein
MSSITQTGSNEQGAERIINRFFKTIGLGQQLKKSNIRKMSGVYTVTLFQYLFTLVFAKHNHYEAMQRREKPFSQDTVYRFINEGSYHWEKFLMLIAVKVTDLIRSWNNSSQRTLALVIDDTTFERGRSKKVELLSWIHDHANHCPIRGFQMLTMVWSDGITTVPCAFRMVASQKADKAIGPVRKDIDKRTLAYHRREKAKRSKPELVVDMLQKAADAGIIAQYVLMDSWYFHPALVARIRQIGFDSIVRMKNNNWCIFSIGQRFYRLEELHKLASQRAKSPFCSILVNMKVPGDIVVPLRIAFAPNTHKKGAWVAFASTDTTLGHEDIICIYGKRWDIEPMFRICKEDLRLESEFQSRSFDAIVAQASIVLTRYTCLALEHRMSSDPRSWGDLIRMCMDDIGDISFHESLVLLLRHIANDFCRRFDLDHSAVQDCLFSSALSVKPFSLSPFHLLLPSVLGCVS